MPVDRRDLMKGAAATAAVAAMPAVAIAAVEQAPRMLTKASPRMSGWHILSRISYDERGRYLETNNIQAPAFAGLKVGDVVDIEVLGERLEGFEIERYSPDTRSAVT